jgi:hypothetical protein
MASADAASPQPAAATTSAARAVRERHVVVLGASETSYTITDALREDGLSVGSWLLPARCCPYRARDQIRNDLAHPATLQSWFSAAMVISVWPEWPRSSLGDVVDPLVHSALGPEPQWLRLTRTNDSSVPRALDAPVILDPYRAHCYLPAATRHYLTDLLQETDPAGILGRTMKALLTALPAAPGRRSHQSFGSCSPAAAW